MVTIKLVMSALFFLTLFSEAAGISQADVGGAVGIGRKFEYMSVNNIGDVPKTRIIEYGSRGGINVCCKLCLQYFNDTQMINFEHFRKICECLKPNPGERPTTISYGPFSGVCDTHETNIPLGDTRYFDTRTVDYLGGVPANIVNECCEKCKEKNPSSQMFEFHEGDQSCYCFRKTTRTPPATLVKKTYSSQLCVTTFDSTLDEYQIPGLPSSLRATAMDEEISITWTPPESELIMVRGYVIGWGNWPNDDLDQYFKIVDNNQRNFVIKNLKPSSDYVISLKAFNKAGYGRPIYDTTRTMDEMQNELTSPIIL